jgi:hypothetical protein
MTSTNNNNSNSHANNNNNSNSGFESMRSNTLANQSLCDQMQDSAIAWSLSNGLIFGKSAQENSFMHAPFT